MEMEQMTRKQAESQLWYQRHRPSSHCFLQVAKRRDTTPVGNLIKNLLKRKPMDVAWLCWGTTHKEDARQAYTAQHGTQGQTVSVQGCGLVIDVENPCLACSPNGRVTSDCDRGLLEIKCPYTAAKEGLTPLQAATDIKGFCCKQSTTEWGTTELSAHTTTTTNPRRIGHYQTCVVWLLRWDTSWTKGGAYQSQFHFLGKDPTEMYSALPWSKPAKASFALVQNLQKKSSLKKWHRQLRKRLEGNNYLSLIFGWSIELVGSQHCGWELCATVMHQILYNHL